MNYYTFNEQNNFIGITGAEPENNLWTLIEPPFFVIPNFNGTEWVEGATEEEINDYQNSLVPVSVKKLQLKLALIQFGIMPSSVLSAINQIEVLSVRETFLTLWNDADFFERNDEKLISMATALGLSSNLIDELFTLASTLGPK